MKIRLVVMRVAAKLDIVYRVSAFRHLPGALVHSIQNANSLAAKGNRPDMVVLVSTNGLYDITRGDEALCLIELNNTRRIDALVARV